MNSLKALRNNSLYKPVLETLSPSLAAKVIGSNDGTQFHLLLESSQIISHPRHIAQLRSSGRCILLPIKARRLLVQQEDVSMSWTKWWRRWANVVGDEWSSKCGPPVGCWPRLEAGLDPMQDWAQDTEGRERSVNVQSDNDIGISGSR